MFHLAQAVTAPVAAPGVVDGIVGELLKQGVLGVLVLVLGYVAYKLVIQRLIADNAAALPG